MAKKSSWWQELIGALTPAASGVVGGLRKAARETMEEAQERIQETTKMVIKALVVFFIIAFGLVFALVGLGKYLDVTREFVPGTGAMIIGVVFVVLGFFAWMMRR